MAVHNLLSKTDKSIVAYLIGEGAGTSEDTFPAKRSGDLPDPPFTGVISETATEEVPYSGVYTVRTAVEIHTNAAPDVEEDTDQMASDSDSRVAAVFDALHDLYDQSGNQLASLITAAGASAGVSDYTMQDVRIVSIEQGKGEKKGEWIDTINLEILCCPSNVS